MPATKAIAISPLLLSSPERFRTTLKLRPPAEAATIVMVMKKADADAMDILDTKKKAAAVTDTEKRGNAAAAVTANAAKKNATASEKAIADATGMDMVTVTAAAENDRAAMDGTVKGVQGWIDCFDGVRLAGVVYGIGADAVGSVKDKAAYEEAYRMGKSVH